MRASWQQTQVGTNQQQTETATVSVQASPETVSQAGAQLCRPESTQGMVLPAQIPALVSGESNREVQMDRLESVLETPFEVVLEVSVPALMLKPSDQVGSALGLTAPSFSKRQVCLIVPALWISQRLAR